MGIIDNETAVGRKPEICQRFRRREWTISHSILKRRALNQLHNECDDVIGVLEAVNRCNVGMIKRRKNLRFAFEAHQSFVVRDVRGKNLDRNFTIQLLIACSIDLTHSTGAYFAEYGVMSEFRAGGYRFAQSLMYCTETLFQINFISTRLVGHIGDPTTVRRELCPTCIKRPRDKFLEH